MEDPASPRPEQCGDLISASSQPIPVTPEASSIQDPLAAPPSTSSFVSTVTTNHRISTTSTVQSTVTNDDDDKSPEGHASSPTADHTENDTDPTSSSSPSLFSCLFSCCGCCSASDATSDQPGGSLMAFWGAAANLCSATLGAGVLSLPHACAQAGLVGSASLLVAAALATVASVQLLIRTCTRYQLYTYESLTEVLYGPWLRRATELCIVLFCQGCAVAYLIAVADILQQANLLVHHSRAVSMILIWTCVLLPLSLFRTMTALQMSSAVGIASIGTLVFAAIVHLIDDTKHEEENQDNDSWRSWKGVTTDVSQTLSLDETGAEWFPVFASNSTTHNSTTTTHDVDWSSMLWPKQGSISILTACPIILFAFSCQVNVCAIYEELIPPPSSSSTTNTNGSRPVHPMDGKQRRMGQVTWVAVAICATLYASIALATLADFGRDGVTPNILSAYRPPLAGIMQVAAAGMVLAVTMAFPLNIFPARVTLEGIVPPSTLSSSCCSGKLSAAVRDEETGESDQDNHGCCSCFRKRPDSRESQPNSMLTQALLSEERQQSPPSDDQDTVTMPIIDDPTTGQPNNTITPERSNGESPEQTRSRTINPYQNDNVEPQEDETGFPWCRHIVLTLALAGSALGIALIAPDISVVFQIVGGTASSMLGFVVPGLMGLRLGRDYVQVDSNPQGSAIVCGSWLLIYAGSLIGLLTTAVTIYQLAGGGGPSGDDDTTSHNSTMNSFAAFLLPSFDVL